MTMRARSLPNVDVTYLDRVFFDSAGTFQPHPLSRVVCFDLEHLQVWCNKRGRYNVPTREQVEFIRGKIGDRSVLEIGAGMGDLGRALGIRMTDSHMQMTPEMQLYYGFLGQKPISPPPDVEKLDAIEAVKKYQPEVVVASWVTQLFQPGDDGVIKIGSSMTGVDEAWVLDHCETYIFVGNERVHKDKRILKRPHETYKFSFLLSRAFEPEDNVIWIWTR